MWQARLPCCSVISSLGDVDQEKGRKTRDIKRGRNLRKEDGSLDLLYIEFSYLCKICYNKRNQVSNSVGTMRLNSQHFVSS